MLRLLGQSEYGLYQLVYSVVSYLSLLSPGFGIEIQRAKNKHNARAVVYLFVAIGNIFISIPCIK